MDLERALRDRFGFPAFRPGQREACNAALAGRDALVVRPTGSGKSLCYQLPALLDDRLAIVVSPLVSLMHDQVEALRARAPGEVALVNAQQDPAANRAALEAAAAGGLRLLYVAPERFSSPGFLEAVTRARRVAGLRGPEARPAIVYAGTRAASEGLAGELSSALGVSAVAYHAGLGRAERADAQRRFMDGRAPVVVATNAFGMGIDKADVRTVAHASVPGSLEAYYQEAGRAGRDGRPARALLFAERRAQGLPGFFIERARVDDGDFERLAQALMWCAGGERYDVDAGELAERVGCDVERLAALVGHLARAGFVQPDPSTPDRLRGRILTPWDGRTLTSCRTSAADAERARWRQYRAIWRFVEENGCRRQAILRHFGDATAPAPEGACCDVCDPGLVGEIAPPAIAAANGDAIAHPQGADLDTAIVDVVSSARPAVGRTR